MNLRQLTNEEKAAILASLDICQKIMEEEPAKANELKLIKAALAVVESGTLMVLEMTPEERKEYTGKVRIELMKQFATPEELPNSMN